MKNVLSFVLLTLGTTAISQTILITNIQPADPGTSPPPTAFQINEISIDFDALKQIPEALRIDFPDGSHTIVPIINFIPRNGFTLRTDDDPPNTPSVYPTPNVPNNELDYLWMGGNSQHDVVLSVADGHLTGTIASKDSRYAIEKNISDVYELIEVNPAGFPECGHIGDSEGLSENTATMHQADQAHQGEPISLNDVLVFNMFNQHYHASNINYTEIDIVVLYNEGARVDAGGDPNDVHDTADIVAKIRASVDNANAAFSISETNTRIVTLYIDAQEFSLANGFSENLRNFKSNYRANYIRDAVGADLAVLMVDNPSPRFSVCGVAYVQTGPDCAYASGESCGVGSDFVDHAFAVVSQDCATRDNTFTHELGHLFGGNHPIRGDNAVWSDAVIASGFPEAFANVTSDFATIMADRYDYPPYRLLHFSNPDVYIDTDDDNMADTATGEAETKDNAKIIDDLSPAMAEFRDRQYIFADIIFIDGFEQ